MIHISKVREILNEDQPVSLKHWNSKGQVIEADSVVQTSSNFHNDTINIKYMESNEIRKINIMTIFEINGQEVCL